ncbi:protein-glutamate O-methyltransferase CheR [Nodularia harveyana UHCC-0300]|uniref:Protein-glutamate O-methyltransferase CheR n=1 Tax=Nodularia harveyana UHCC-0300 TaxID=2974287 RepID=A0ABU5UH67_9CYAN|nr:protein-glutamate O-methyltransferase CheR [Nodularia harveyana]MEA5582564.1 protein-glutamate O-methyltransferase CheR [Nodularia harveyana UHCC-0300]
MNLPKSSLEDIEIKLLLEGIYQYYGYDYRNYALSSLKRRIHHFMRSEGLNNISALQEKLFHESTCIGRFVLSVTVNVTSMFRDPSFYLAFRTQVIPLLRTYPFIRIWHAGCSTGEEVYSMAILLQEEELYHRCRIYATDTNENVLNTAKNGIYPLKKMQEYTQLYLQTGGKRCFSEYYTAAYDSAIFRASLRDNVIFAQHNLATDSSFNEFNVILCRNVLIYFNKILQKQVNKLLYNSLCTFGILGLGRQESLKFTSYEEYYQELTRGEKLYRRLN